MAIETEIKFRVADVAELETRLKEAGFRLETPRAFESNVLYDTPDRQMRARTEILRIRSYAGRYTVTHKRLPDSGLGEDTQKWRSEWSDGQGHCVVDETPIGNFAELEGTAEWIDRAAERIGVSRSDYLTLSYGRLFEQWCVARQCAANDLTFEAVAAACGPSAR